MSTPSGWMLQLVLKMSAFVIILNRETILMACWFVLGGKNVVHKSCREPA